MRRLACTIALSVALLLAGAFAPGSGTPPHEQPLPDRVWSGTARA